MPTSDNGAVLTTTGYADYGSDPTTGGNVTDSGTNISLSGLGGLFSAVGSAFSNAYKAVNPVVQAPNAGSLVWNPSTGTYQSPASVAGGSLVMPLVLLLLGGVAIYVVMKKA